MTTPDTIETVAGTAHYSHTVVESSNEDWGAEQYTTKRGYWCLHEENKHHVYKVKKVAP